MHSLLPLSLLLVGTAAYYDTVLEKKCMALKRTHENAAYVEGLCFVALREKISITYDKWPSLHESCRMINGYKGQLAVIPNRPFLDKLFKSDVLKVGANRSKYFTGARQFPIPDCSSNGGTCKGEDQKKNWFFFDEKNNQIAPIDASTWMTGEPGNQEVPETIAILESFDSYTGGLNDANPTKEAYQPLCQFTDYLKCAEGYILIRDRCYKIFTDELNAVQSKSKCEGDGGVLASIHDDAMNAIIIDYARDGGRSIEQPIRFGLGYATPGGWSNDDGTPADFFRWYDQAGCGVPTPFKSGNTRAALVVSPSARAPDASYWMVAKDSDALPYLCAKQPGKAYDSA